MSDAKLPERPSNLAALLGVGVTNYNVRGWWWLVGGNPTQTTGRFRDCFPGGRFAQRWHQFTVDSRNAAAATNKAQILGWIEDYGDDDDFVRVRVKGEFPRSSIFRST